MRTKEKNIENNATKPAKEKKVKQPKTALALKRKVGLTQRRSCNGFKPPCVTHATSGAKPSTWSFSFCKRLSGMNIGM